MKNIRPATRADIEKVSAIHMNSFVGFFMTNLGIKFIKKYYEFVLSYPKSIFLIAEQNDFPIGFVAGFVEPSRFYSILKRQKINLGLAMLPALIRKPWLLFRIFYNFRHVNASSEEKTEFKCELASIAVDPIYAKQGIGKSLVKTFIENSQKLGVEVIYLTTDAKNNDAVNHFYQSLGFKLHRKFKSSHNRAMNEYRFYLNNN